MCPRAPKLAKKASVGEFLNFVTTGTLALFEHLASIFWGSTPCSPPVGEHETITRQSSREAFCAATTFSYVLGSSLHKDT